MKAKQFHHHFIFLFLGLIMLIFFTPRMNAIRIKFSGPSSSLQELHPWRHTSPSSSSSTKDMEFESQKRRIPTGSNPLHNKR
ncbi:hypothetical protein K1719_019932 [Acacia pycnantha]|nr:hypothetical protein K1719_046346 [Acacia pycnantha]KAI9108977.1 hypothetical protein K1719_019932 [Acacia pycnantha]